MPAGISPATSASEAFTQLMTGGTGGLGLVTVSWLAALVERGTALALVSRGGALAADAAYRLRASGVAGVTVHRCDVAQATEAASLISGIQRSLPRVRGVWHAAGVLADGLLHGQDVHKLARVCGAKAGGAWHLHRSHATTPLTTCTYFSSIAGLVGSAAQANYASANAYLDGFATCRRAQGCVGVSVCWGPWAAVGMAAGDAINAHMGAMGIGRIDAWQGLAALRALLQAGTAVAAFWLVRWEVLLYAGPSASSGPRKAPPLFERLAPPRPPARAESAKIPKVETTPATAMAGAETVLEFVRRTVGDVTDLDVPLVELGLDSLGAEELKNLLQQALSQAGSGGGEVGSGVGGVELPSTLIVDYPNARSLVGLVEGELEARRAQRAARGPQEEGGRLSERASFDLQTVLEASQRTTGDLIDADVPLLEAGLDSLGAEELRSQLQQMMAGGRVRTIDLPSTLILDHPTARLLTMELQALSGHGARGDDVGSAAPLQTSPAAIVEEAKAAAQPQAASASVVVSPPSTSTSTSTVITVAPAPPHRVAAEPIPVNLTTLGTRLGGAFEVSQLHDRHPSLVLLRPAKVLVPSKPSLVIVHSFLGDESGYERLWQLCFADRAVFALRHRFLVSSDCDTSVMPSASDMLSGYAQALSAVLLTQPFDLIGASYGSLVAFHLGHAAREADACPRKLILVDPFPCWPSIRLTAPTSSMLSSGSDQHDARTAASVILKLRLQAQHGAEEGEAILATLNESLKAVPSDAVGLFLAAQALPPDASPTELLVQALRERRRVMAVASVGPTITDLVEGLRPFHSSEKPSEDGEDSSAPALMVVLSSERKAFFEDVYGTSEFDSDALEAYGPSLEPMRFEGKHFEVVTRCISNREPGFTKAAESFLS